MAVFLDGDMYQGLFREQTLHQVGFGLGFQCDVEHPLSPSLGRPPLRFAQIVDSPPVSESNDFVEVHLEEVGTHIADACLTLVERHPREASSIAGEIHIPIIIGLYVCLHGKVARQRVRFPVAIARMHGYGNQTGGVVTLQSRFHHLVARHAKVVEGLVGILLQFVAQTPKYNRGRITIALYPFCYVLYPVIHKRYATSSMLLCPFVVEFVDHQYTIFVTKPDEVATIRIVRRADVVQSELLHQLDAFLDGTRIGCSSQSPQGVVVGITLQQYLLAIQLQTKVRTYLNGANAKLLTHLVSHTSILTYQSDYCCVKVGMLCVPELWIWNLHLREFGLHGTSRRDAFATILSLVNQLPLWVVDFQSYASCARLGAIGQFCGYVDEAVVTRCDVQWMALEIEVG